MVTKRQQAAGRKATASTREGGSAGPGARAEELAPAGARGKAASPQGSDLETLLGRSREELLALAADLGLKGSTKLAKPELAKRVHSAQARAAGASQVRAPASAAPRADAKAPPKPGLKTGAAKPPAAERPAGPEKKPGAPARTAETKAGAPAGGKAAVRTAERPPAPIAPPREIDAAPAPGPGPHAEPEPPSAGEVPKERPSPAAAARLDLGHASPARAREEHIPWSYGQDRVTAMAVDPETLYVYWEVTDPALERARAALGAAGEGAWLNLRVFDTSGIIFDGGNAHSWFDHGLGRSDRQWFFRIGKPSSSATVEIGMRAPDGGFARIARSSRVEFPPAAPGPWTEPEWMTVLASGEPVLAGRGAPIRAGGGADGADGGPVGGGERHDHVPVWILLEPGEGERRFRELFGEHWERIEWREGGAEGWYELQGRLEWQSGPYFSSWEEGPFTYPVQVEPPSRSTWEGGALAYTAGGVTRVVYGPWQVVIRNLGGHAAHALLGRWQIYRSWATSGGIEEVRRMATSAGAPGGASERVAASGWLWRAGSEQRLGGASELWRIGASEVRLRGASELLYAGASERRAMGASERSWAGASEWRLGGASERQLQGASEQRLGGASEWQLQGASERRLGGASERVLGGASEHRLGGSEERLGGSPAEDENWDWPPVPSAPGRE